jgi:hypothetical protein
MKRILYLILFLFMISCNDGNLDIASFEFEEKINVCGEFTLYRLSTNGAKETLMVTLTDKEIKNDEEIVLPVNVTENGAYTVTDRVFASEVTDSYFCATVPPSEPKVLKDWRGNSGTILVENKPVLDDDGVTIIAWEHIIVLKDVVLKSGEESLIFNDVFLYGTFQTSVN